MAMSSFFQKLFDNVPVGYRIFYHHFLLNFSMRFFYVLVKFLELKDFWLTETKHILRKWKIVMFEVKYLGNYMSDFHLMRFVKLQRF